MIFHASVPADDPERVARALAEVLRGEHMPFPPYPGENRFLVELLTAEMQRAYLDFMTPSRFRALFGL
jgi:hypothetical protein